MHYEADKIRSSIIKISAFALVSTPRAVAVDGKTVRGARDHAIPDDRAPHLVSAVTHEEGVVLAQARVDDKSNEITAVQPPLW